VKRHGLGKREGPRLAVRRASVGGERVSAGCVRTSKKWVLNFTRSGTASDRLCNCTLAIPPRGPPDGGALHSRTPQLVLLPLGTNASGRRHPPATPFSSLYPAKLGVGCGAMELRGMPKAAFTHVHALMSTVNLCMAPLHRSWATPWLCLLGLFLQHEVPRNLDLKQL
jgi:hypothetical protein